MFSRFLAIFDEYFQLDGTANWAKIRLKVNITLQ
jgi:hypothetical protein